MLDRTKVTFAQAEGAAPLPSQLQLRQISRELTSRLWFAIHGLMKHYLRENDHNYDTKLTGKWLQLTRDWFLREHGFIDEFNPDGAYQIARIKKIVTSENYIEVFDFIQHILRGPYVDDTFREYVAKALIDTRSAYRVIDNTIMPIGSEEEATAVTNAFNILAADITYAAPRKHLRSAAENLSTGKWADSARESIHAVESMAKILEPEAKTLGPALKRLEAKGRVNPNLHRGMTALYNYTSDEQGIRHALVDGADARVSEADALFMFGACASFVTYLIKGAG